MSAEDPSTSIFEWTPPSAGVPRPVLGTDSLAEAVAPLADDRGAAADDQTSLVASMCKTYTHATSKLMYAFAALSEQYTHFYRKVENG